jgi:hypothetical protein
MNEEIKAVLEAAHKNPKLWIILMMKVTKKTEI